jgi:DNA transformation protein
MFGGMCLYQDGTVFALLSSDGTLHLKAPGDIATELAALGGSQFHSMPYWTLPDAALDDPDIALDWARRALSSL